MNARLVTNPRGPVANATSRRTSLLTLGTAALAALASHSPAAAKKNKHKARKKSKEQCEKQGPSCREFANQMCALFHPPSPIREACVRRADACCSPLEDCNGGEYFACLLDHLEDLA